MIHLFTPGQAEKDVLAAGKLFVEKMLLHRTVGLKLTRVDDNGNLQGRVYFPAGEISYEILKNGYSRLTAPKDMDFDPDYYRDLK